MVELVRRLEVLSKKNAKFARASLRGLLLVFLVSLFLFFFAGTIEEFIEAGQTETVRSTLIEREESLRQATSSQKEADRRLAITTAELGLLDRDLELLDRDREEGFEPVSLDEQLAPGYA